MPLAGILFDKDGTFVDFDKTWGTAAYEVMRIMSVDDPEVFGRIVEAMHYEVGTRRFRPTSPLIAGATDTYVHLWAEAVRRCNDATMLADLNRYFADETLRALAPLGRPSDVMDALHTQRVEAWARDERFGGKRTRPGGGARARRPYGLHGGLR